MISIKIRQVNFRLHWGFLCLFFLLFVFNSWKLALLTAIFSLFHELAHAYMAKLLGYSPSMISAGLFGGVLHLEEGYIEPVAALLIHSAGPMLNLGIGMACYYIILIKGYDCLYSIVLANLMLAIFNLLPLYPLDGGKILNIYLNEFFGHKKSYLISRLVSKLFCIILFLFGLYLVQYNLVNLIVCALAFNLYIAGREDYRYSYDRLRNIYARLEEDNKYDIGR